FRNIGPFPPVRLRWPDGSPSCYRVFSSVLQSSVEILVFCSTVEGSSLPSCLGLAKWVSIVPVPWICLCNLHNCADAPIQDGSTKVTGNIPDQSMNKCYYNTDLFSNSSPVGFEL